MLRRHSVFSQQRFPVPSSFSFASYTFSSLRNFFTKEEHRRSILSPDDFWSEKAIEGISWTKNFTQVAPKYNPDLEYGATNNSPIWFKGGELNFCYNCVDRHVLAGNGNKIAFIYDSPVTQTKPVSVSYFSLLQRVCLLARVLTEKLIVKTGDCVTIYMPNTVDAVVAMLAVSRVGGIHNVVFGGFSSPELAKRIVMSNSKVLLTCSGGIEVSRHIDYVAIVEDAMKIISSSSSEKSSDNNNKLFLEHVLFLQREHIGFRKIVLTPDGNKQNHFFGIGKDWKSEIENIRLNAALEKNQNKDNNNNNINNTTNNNNFLSASSEISKFSWYFPPVSVPSEHPLYYLFTSGSTGIPKCVIRDTGGYAVMLHHTMSSVYGLPTDAVMCTASDIGWVVGHSYTAYGPILYGATSVIYEGKPISTPDSGSFFRLIEEHNVNVFFASPTALRAIRGVDPEAKFRNRYDISSLKTLFVAGERTDPSTLSWAQSVFGVPVIDNMWQSETGAPITSACWLNSETKQLDVREGAAGVACPGWNLTTSTSFKHHAEQEEEETGKSHGIHEIVAKLPLPPGCLIGLKRHYASNKNSNNNNNENNLMHQTYCSDHTGYYCTFDAGKIDEDGFVHFMSRSDDIINVAAHRLSTGQLEQVVSAHPSVAECAVVPKPCSLKGHRPVAFVVLKSGIEAAPDLLEDIHHRLRREVGAIATADIVIVAKLPKTRSGKTLRRLLRAIVSGITKKEDLPIAPTIEDESVIDLIINSYIASNKIF